MNYSTVCEFDWPRSLTQNDRWDDNQLVAVKSGSAVLAIHRLAQLSALKLSFNVGPEVKRSWSCPLGSTLYRR